MNARNYRTELNLSPLDFPALNGLYEHSIFITTDPPVMVDNKITLKLTTQLVITEFYTKKEHKVLTGQSIYGIPTFEIKTREDVYEFFKDATLVLKEAYQYVLKHQPLPDLSFPTNSIEAFQKEINGVFYLLNSQN